MVLIYLDTRHLARLALAMEQEPERFSSFLDVWRSGGHWLALTRLHLLELRRHADPAVRGAWPSLLGHLLPIRTDIPAGPGVYRPPALLSTREIIGALLLTGEIDIRGDDYEEWVTAYATGLPCQIDDPAGVEPLRAFDDPVFDSITRIMRSAAAQGGEARRAGAEAGGPGALPSLQYDPARPRPSVGVPSGEALWSHEVLDVLRNVLWVQAEAPALSKLVALEDCPGTWLSRSVAREIQRGGPASAPGGDGYDVEHLCYLPYVHRFFTDERVAGHVRQVLDAKGVPPRYRGMRKAEAVPDSVDDLRKALAEGNP